MMIYECLMLMLMLCKSSYARLTPEVLHPMELLGDVGHVESRSVRLEMVLVLVQDRCSVCAKRPIASYQV